MWSLFACKGGVVVVVGVVSDVAFVALDGGGIGAGGGSCERGRGSGATGVGMSVTLGSTDANLGVVNGSEGGAEGVSKDPKKSRPADQHNKQCDHPSTRTRRSRRPRTLHARPRLLFRTLTRVCLLPTPPIRDQQPLRLPCHHRMGRILVLAHLVIRTKHPRQKFQNPIDSILMLLMPLSRRHRLLPQVLVRTLQLVQVGRDGCLMSLNRLYPVHDRVDVQELVRRQRGHGHVITRRVLGCRGRGCMRILARRRRALFPLYETQQVGLTT